MLRFYYLSLFLNIQNPRASRDRTRMFVCVASRQVQTMEKLAFERYLMRNSCIRWGESNSLILQINAFMHAIGSTMHQKRMEISKILSLKYFNQLSILKVTNFWSIMLNLIHISAKSSVYLFVILLRFIINWHSNFQAHSSTLTPDQTRWWRNSLWKWRDCRQESYEFGFRISAVSTTRKPMRWKFRWNRRR